MTAHSTIRSLALAALVLVAATGVGAAAGASSGPDGLRFAVDDQDSTDDEKADDDHGVDDDEDADGDLQVRASATHDGVDLTVTYRGDGIATLTVAGVDGGYGDAGSWQVDGEQTVYLTAPGDADTVRATVEAPNLTVERTVEFDTITYECGQVSTERRVPTTVTYAWSSTVGDESRSDSHTVDLPVEDIPCPTPAASDEERNHVDLWEYVDQIDKRLAAARERMAASRPAVPDDGSGERRSDDGSEDGDENDTRDERRDDRSEGDDERTDGGDEASDERADGSDGNGDRDGQGDETGDASGDSPDGVLSVLWTVTGDVVDSTGSNDEAGDGSEDAGDAVRSLIDQVVGDAQNQADTSDRTGPDAAPTEAGDVTPNATGDSRARAPSR